MPNSPALGEFTLGLAELGAGTQIIQMFETLTVSDSSLLDLVAAAYETLALADSITTQWLIKLAEAMGIDDTQILNLTARPGESINVEDLAAAQVETIVNELMGIDDAAKSTRLIVMLESFGLTDAQITEFTSRPQESMNIDDTTITAQEITVEESLAVADASRMNATLTHNETLGVSDDALSSRIARAFETMAVADSIAAVMETEMAETLSLSDAHIMAQAIKIEQGLNFAESTYLLSEVIVGVKGFISTILDIDSTDFCSLVDESGNVVQKTNVTPVFQFQAFLYQKQTKQLFDFGINTFPGDAVMFYCPELDPPLVIGDTLLSNGIHYTIIDIRDKLIGPNIIYKKAALRKKREDNMLPVITMFGASPNESGSSTISWSPIDSILYPWFKEYEVLISEDNIDYLSYRKTTGTSISASGLELGKTYYFKVRGISLTNDVGPLSAPVDCALPTDSLVVLNLMATLNTSGSSTLSWSPISSVDYGYLQNYQIFISENDIDFTLHREVTPSNTSITGLEAGKTYYFKVRAVSKFGDTGPLTASVNCGLPVAELEVTDLACTKNETGTVALTWSPVDSTVYDYIELYQVFISENGTDYRLHREPTTPNLALSNLEPGKTYYFQVRAISKFNEIGAMAGPVDSALAAFDLPDVPWIRVGDNQDGTIELKWGQLDPDVYKSLKAYRVYCQAPGATYNLVGTTTGQSFNAKVPDPNVAYLFKVIPEDIYGRANITTGAYVSNKDYRNLIAAVTISGVRAVGDVGKMTVYWNDIAKALSDQTLDYYEVEYAETASYQLGQTTTSNQAVFSALSAGTWKARVRAVFKSRDYTDWYGVTGVAVT